MDISVGQIYKHYKGNRYKILALARHSDTLEEFIVYQGLYPSEEFGDQPVWIRPKTAFLENILMGGVPTKRFTKIS